MAKRNKTDYIVIHCSATKADNSIGADRIREWHISPPRNWNDIGYHFVIRRDGLIEAGRPIDDVGAHVAGFNTRSLGICLVGGYYGDGKEVIEDISHYSAEQIRSLEALLKMLKRMYPDAEIVGHRDLSPDKNMDGKITRGEWLKTCPGFNAKEIFKDW